MSSDATAEVCVNPAWPTLPDSSVSEQKVWDEILRQHGLDMQKGTPDWLQYGASYFDHEQSVAYDTAEKRPHRRTAANYLRAKQLWELVSAGISMRKAARQLGISWATACRIRKQHREHFSWPTFQDSSEGKL